MRKFGNMLWGIVFIVLGLIFGLNALGYTDINIFFQGWWTLFIIIPSFIGLFKERNKTGSIIGIIIGVVLLLCAQGVVSFSNIRKLIIPFVFVAIGLSIVFNEAIGKQISKRVKELNKGGLENYSAIFSAQNVVLGAEEFKGVSLDAVFGGVEYDMRAAKVTADQIINASAIFGGIDILVPNNVNVKVKSTPIFGGTSNKSIVQRGENIPTIYVNSFCLFGGVEIK